MQEVGIGGAVGEPRRDPVDDQAQVTDFRRAGRAKADGSNLELEAIGEVALRHGSQRVRKGHRVPRLERLGGSGDSSQRARYGHPEDGKRNTPTGRDPDAHDRRVASTEHGKPGSRR